MEQEIQEIRKMLSEIYTVLLGNPTDPDKPGHHTRIDRLERSSYLQNKILWLVGSGVVLMGLDLIKGLLWSR